METKVTALWRANPVRAAAAIASIVVFVAASCGIVLDQTSVINAILAIVPIVLAAEASRREVIPVHSLVADYDQLPDDPVNNPIVQPVKKDAA